MRILTVIVLILAVLLGAGWLGGESWVAGRVSAMIDARADLSASSVRPLRETDRIGLHLTDAAFDGPVDGKPLTLDLPWLDLWVVPTAPYELHADLPDSARLDLDGVPVAAEMTGAGASLRLAPASSMTLSRANLQVQSVELDGQAAIGDLSASARLVGLGHDAPRAAGAAYEVALRLDQADPVVLARLGLPQLALPGMLSLDGGLRMWLNAAPGPRTFEGDSPAPHLVGFRSDRLNLTLGGMSAQLRADISADEQGRAEGRLALYTRDSKAWLDAAAKAGLIPDAGVLLGGAMLQNLSAMPMPMPMRPAEAAKPRVAVLADAASAAVATVVTAQQTASPTATGAEGAGRLGETTRSARIDDDFTFPEPAQGEIRLPIFLREGQIFLGSIPIGPSPRFPRG